MTWVNPFCKAAYEPPPDPLKEAMRLLIISTSKLRLGEMDFVRTVHDFILRQSK